jgi:hypothetical protein
LIGDCTCKHLQKYDFIFVNIKQVFVIYKDAGVRLGSFGNPKPLRLGLCIVVRLPRRWLRAIALVSKGKTATGWRGVAAAKKVHHAAFFAHVNVQF